MWIFSVIMHIFFFNSRNIIFLKNDVSWTGTNKDDVEPVTPLVLSPTPSNEPKPASPTYSIGIK